MCGTNPLNFDLWFYSGDIPGSNKRPIRRTELTQHKYCTQWSQHGDKRPAGGLDAAQTL